MFCSQCGKEIPDNSKFCIECGKDAGEWVTKNKLNMTFEEDSNIKKPQDLEYEKTFYPFILISKKRYVADKYEFDINECILSNYDRKYN